MELNKIIFDPINKYSFGIYRQSGKMVSQKAILCWLSTKHNKDELKKIYPNTSIVLLNSPQLGDYEKGHIESLIKDTTWLETDFYKIGFFNSDGWSSLSLERGDHYFFDWKAESYPINIEYLPLKRKNQNPRCFVLSVDIRREIRLDQLLSEGGHHQI